MLHSRLQAVKAELWGLNSELETFLKDERVVMEYEGAATSALVLLEHHMNTLKVSSQNSMTQRPATTDEGQAMTLTAETM